MALDLAVEGLGAVARVLFRMVAWLVAELFLEVLIRGTGRLVLRGLRPREEPDEGACTLVGLLVWAVVIVALVALLY